MCVLALAPIHVALSPALVRGAGVVLMKKLDEQKTTVNESNAIRALQLLFVLSPLFTPFITILPVMIVWQGLWVPVLFGFVVAFWTVPFLLSLLIFFVRKLNGKKILCIYVGVMVAYGASLIGILIYESCLHDGFWQQLKQVLLDPQTYFGFAAELALTFVVIGDCIILLVS